MSEEKTMQTVAHTPTPWTTISGRWIANLAIGVRAIAEVFPRSTDEGAPNANAAYIVECVNGHASLLKEREELRRVLSRYVAAYPAFRIKPEGAPGSQVRDEQERLMALEDAAAALLRSQGEGKL